MTTATSRVGPEKPPHIDARITDIGEDDLIAAVGAPDGVHDLPTLREHLTGRRRPALWSLADWARAHEGGPEAMKARADAEVLSSPDFDVSGEAHGRSARYGFHYLRWLVPGVKVWLLTGERRWLDLVADRFDTWYERRNAVTGDWPGLDVIWYSLGTWARASQLLPCLDALHSSPLPDSTWARMLGTVVGGARWAHEEHDTFRHGNWQLASASQLMHVGLVYPELVEAGDWVERGRERLEEHLLLDVYPDGGHYERSPGYHSMCLEAVQLAATLDELYLRTGLAGHPQVVAMHRWLQRMTSSGGWVPHLQDSGVVWSGSHLARGGWLLSDPDLLAAGRRWLPTADFVRETAALPRWPDAERQARWEEMLRDTVAGQSRGIGPEGGGDDLLPDTGYALLRAGGLDDEVRAVVNFGPHIEHELESHSHQAVWDFVLEGWGRPLLWEAGGPPSYDDPGYYSWFQSGRGHNTVLVDGREPALERESTYQEGWSGRRVGMVEGRHRGNDMMQNRSFVLVREAPYYLVVRDRAAEAETTGHAFELRLHGVAPWTAGDVPGAWSSGDGPGVTALIAQYDDAAEVEFTTGPARIPDPVSRAAEYGTVHTLAMRRSEGNFDTVLLPWTAPGGRTQVSVDDEVLRVDHGEQHDEIGDRQVARFGPDGTLRWAAVWHTHRIVVRGRELLRSTVPLSGELDCTDGCRVRLTVPSRCRVILSGRPTALRLSGVRLSVPDEQGTFTVTLPHAGTWEIDGYADG